MHEEDTTAPQGDTVVHSRRSSLNPVALTDMHEDDDCYSTSSAYLMHDCQGHRVENELVCVMQPPCSAPLRVLLRPSLLS